MNKNDLVAVVADKTGLSKAEATKSVDCVFDAITDSLKSGEEVRLVGFGTFNVTRCYFGTAFRKTRGPLRRVPSGGG